MQRPINSAHAKKKRETKDEEMHTFGAYGAVCGASSVTHRRRRQWWLQWPGQCTPPLMINQLPRCLFPPDNTGVFIIILIAYVLASHFR